LGFDIKPLRTEEWNKPYERIKQVSAFRSKYEVSCNLKEIRSSNIFIITLPTPIDEYKRQDLSPLIKTAESVGKI